MLVVTFIVYIAIKLTDIEKYFVRYSEKLTKVLQKKLQTGIITAVGCNLILFSFS